MSFLICGMFLQYLPVLPNTKLKENEEKVQTNRVLSKIFSKHSHEILNVGKVKAKTLFSGFGLLLLICLCVK